MEIIQKKIEIKIKRLAFNSLRQLVASAVNSTMSYERKLVRGYFINWVFLHKKLSKKQENMKLAPAIFHYNCKLIKKYMKTYRNIFLAHKQSKMLNLSAEYFFQKHSLSIFFIKMRNAVEIRTRMKRANSKADKYINAKLKFAAFCAWKSKLINARLFIQKEAVVSMLFYIY